MYWTDGNTAGGGFGRAFLDLMVAKIHWKVAATDLASQKRFAVVMKEARATGYLWPAQVFSLGKGFISEQKNANANGSMLATESPVSSDKLLPVPLNMVSVCAALPLQGGKLTT